MGESMRRIQTALYSVGFVLSAQFAICVAFADEPAPLTEQEIVTRLFGNTLQQRYRTTTGEYPGIGWSNLYLDRDGKLLAQYVDQGPVPKIEIATVSVEDGQFCINRPEVVAPDPVRRKVCNQLWPDTGDAEHPQDVYLRFSGLLGSSRIQLLPGDSNEQGALREKWERILATTGHIDARPRIDAIATAPDGFKGKVLMMQGKFLRMLTPDLADFEAYDNQGGDRSFRLEGVRDDLFLGEAEDFLIFATLTTVLRRTGEFGRDTQVTLSAKLVLPCKQLLCRDWLGMRH
jgi:hypothetical protein